jgi:hypothetical protein
MSRKKRAFRWKDRPTNDVSVPERGEEGRLDIGTETRAVDRAVEKPWGVDAVVAQGGEEGHCSGPPSNRWRAGPSLQWPCGTPAVSRDPRGAHPRSGAMLVLVHVSSMKTRRDGSIRP